MTELKEKDKSNLAGILYLMKLALPEGFYFRIRLQKMVLLAKQEFSFPFSFNYESHYYGPYSEQLQSFVSDCVNNDYISEKIIEIGEESFGSLYSLTKDGEKILNSLSFPKEEFNKLDKVWTTYKDKPTELLVKKAKEMSGIKSKNE